MTDYRDIADEPRAPTARERAAEIEATMANDRWRAAETKLAAMKGPGGTQAREEALDELAADELRQDHEAEAVKRRARGNCESYPGQDPAASFTPQSRNGEPDPPMVAPTQPVSVDEMAKMFPADPAQPSRLVELIAAGRSHRKAAKRLRRALRNFIEGA